MYFRDCDKDGSIVAARLAGATGRISCGRPVEIRVHRHSDAQYFEDLAGVVVGHYRSLPSTALLNSRIVVLGSVHRAALYVAEALHAPLLPLQFLSFSQTLAEAQSAGMLSIAGTDHDVDALWQ